MGRMSLKIFSLFLAAAMLLSCATLFKGTSEELSINSDPQRAQVFINGDLYGETPISVNLESKETYTIEFKKEGYETKTFQLNNHVGAGWIVLDVLGGLVPVIVDAATGAWYHLDQKNVNMILEKQQPVSII
jgi:hypothetical protein